MNARIGLAVGAVAVAALIILLVIKTRETAGDHATAAPGVTEAMDPGAPRRMEAAPGPPDASPLPTPEEVAEAKAQVEAEHIRSPSHAPEILDNNFKAQPMKAARRAMQKGDYEGALQQAEKALAVEPDSNTARVMAVMAACSLGDRSVAQAHADKLDDMRKSRVAVRCQKFGIEIRGAKPLAPDE